MFYNGLSSGAGKKQAITTRSRQNNLLVTTTANDKLLPFPFENSLLLFLMYIVCDQIQLAKMLVNKSDQAIYIYICIYGLVLKKWLLD